MANIQVTNQMGEAGGVFVNTTGVQTGNFAKFKIVENTVFGSITNPLFVDVINITGITLSAGNTIPLFGTTSFNLSSGSVIAYDIVKTKWGF